MFFEIAKELFVRIDEIESIKSDPTSNMKCIVRTHHNIFESTFPLDVLLQLIQMKVSADKREESRDNKNEEKSLTSQYWVG